MDGNRDIYQTTARVMSVSTLALEWAPPVSPEMCYAFGNAYPSAGN